MFEDICKERNGGDGRVDIYRIRIAHIYCSVTGFSGAPSSALQFVYDESLLGRMVVSGAREDEHIFSESG